MVLKPDREPVGGSTVPVIDLNELLLDHPAACYAFSCGEDLLIVDRAAPPHDGSLVVTERRQGFFIEPYQGQQSWGVVMYKVLKLTPVILLLLD